MTMPKTMQKLVVMMEPTEDAYDTPLRGGNMILNRFCIDEDAGFELFGVNELRKSSWELRHGNSHGNSSKLGRPGDKFKSKRKVKGKEYSFLWSHFILRSLIFTNNSELPIHYPPKKNVVIRKLSILHYIKFLKTSPKTSPKTPILKFTSFMQATIILIMIMKTN